MIEEIRRKIYDECKIPQEMVSMHTIPTTAELIEHLYKSAWEIIEARRK